MHFGTRRMRDGAARLSEKFAYGSVGREFGFARSLARRQTGVHFRMHKINPLPAFYFVKIANLTTNKKCGPARAQLDRQKSRDLLPTNYTTKLKNKYLKPHLLNALQFHLYGGL